MNQIEESRLPRVSVITATHNGERFIGRAIDSVLSQTMSDFEFIIVDDGSTDSTPDLLREAASRDPRIRVIFRPEASGGPTIPKNIGLSLAGAPYVCFLDHDDYLHPEKLFLTRAALDNNPAWVAAFHDVQLVTADEVPHQGTYLSNAKFLSVASEFLTPLPEAWYDCSEEFYVFMSLRYAAMHTASVMLAPQRLMKDPVSFRARFKGCDDTDLWLRIGAQGRVGYVNKVLAYYRIHDANLSADTTTMTNNALEVMEDNFLRGRQRFNAEQRKQYRAKMRLYRLNLAYALAQQRKYREAMGAYYQSLRFGQLYRSLRGIAKVSLMQMLNK